MTTSFARDTDEKAIALINELKSLGIEVKITTNEGPSALSGEYIVTRTATLAWQTHNGEAKLLRKDRE